MKVYSTFANVAYYPSLLKLFFLDSLSMVQGVAMQEDSCNVLYQLYHYFISSW